MKRFLTSLFIGAAVVLSLGGLFVVGSIVLMMMGMASYGSSK